MTKPSVVIGLFLSPLLIFAGCGGLETRPRPTRGDIGAPVRPAATEQHRKSEEPDDDSALGLTQVKPENGVADTTEAPAPPATAAQVEDQPPTEAIRTEATSTPEPNVPDLPDAPQGTPITESAPPAVIEAEVPEPNEPPTLPTEEVAEAEAPPEQPQRSADEPAALASFYQGYAEVLREYVLKDGRVDYAGLRRKRLQLKQLLSEPDELDPNVYQGWSEDEKIAFWINTYNVKMLEIIARNYPIQSSWWLRLTWPPSDLRHIEGIWSDYRFIVMDEEFTLGDVERRIFHRAFPDPRVYLAITYGARSGPRLPRAPYRGDALNDQLDEQVKRFLASGKGLRIDRDNQVVYLSALFKPSWRGKDFLARHAMQKKFKDRPAETRAVLNFLTHYVSPDDVYFLEVENYTIVYTNFDWRINDSAAAN